MMPKGYDPRVLEVPMYGESYVRALRAELDEARTAGQAIETLRTAGWHISTMKGRGRVHGGILVTTFHPEGENHERILIGEPWRPVPDETGGSQ